MLTHALHPACRSYYDCEYWKTADYYGRPSYSQFSILDCLHPALTLQAGLHAPLTVFNVSVWQLDGSRNLVYT